MTWQEHTFNQKRIYKPVACLYYKLELPNECLNFNGGCQYLFFSGALKTFKPKLLYLLFSLKPLAVIL